MGSRAFANEEVRVRMRDPAPAASRTAWTDAGGGWTIMVVEDGKRGWYAGR